MTQKPKPRAFALASVVVSATLLAGTAHALPVGFKNSWMNMGEFSRDFREFDTVYTFTPQDGIGLEFVEMRLSAKNNPNAQTQLNSTGLHYNRRLARWNGERSQANIYALVGLGQASGSYLGNSQTIFLPGLQADYETRRVYVAARAHGYRSDGFKGVRWGATAGFSFYETDYEQWQPWVVLDYSGRSGDLSGREVTPTFRLIHKTFFLDVGAPFSSGKSQGLKLNFRYTH